MMIHDIHFSVREITAPPDLINMQDRGNSIPDFITIKSRQMGQTNGKDMQATAEGTVNKCLFPVKYIYMSASMTF